MKQAVALASVTVPDQQSPSRLVGFISAAVAHLLTNATREVRVTESTDDHIAEHGNQFDVFRAMQLVPAVLAEPLFVVRANKRVSVLFVGEFDDRYYLIVPVKLLPGESWLETLFIDRKTRFSRRGYLRERLLYARQT